MEMQERSGLSPEVGSRLAICLIVAGLLKSEKAIQTILVADWMDEQTLGRCLL
jgi:hypothetical protein